MRKLLHEVFNHDFEDVASPTRFHARFFEKSLTIADLRKVHDAIQTSRITIDGKTIHAAILIPASLPHRGRAGVGAGLLQDNNSARSKIAPLPASPLRGEELPFAILAQMHGNEPAGLAGILLAMALADAGVLARDVIGIIGNPLAAKQYFEAWERMPKARQETRDAFRCGLAKDGALLPDMNRIPVDFLTRDASDQHIRRAQELHAIAKQVSGVADIHSARGNMICITDHESDAHLRDSPIRSVMTGLANAISANASKTVAVQTFKSIAVGLPNIECEIGIEAGRHESPEAPYIAASFTLSLLHTLGLTSITPMYDQENGVFKRYAVEPRITYSDLQHEDTLHESDKIYMAKACTSPDAIPKNSTVVAVRKEDGDYKLQPILEYLVTPAGELAYVIHQYEEMEAIAKDQIVAIAIPSGTTFAAPSDFSGIFLSKSAALYDKDPNVGPWPVMADKIKDVKFCYPCKVEEMKVKF